MAQQSPFRKKNRYRRAFPLSGRIGPHRSSFLRKHPNEAPPESTTLFRNPAAGADITAFTMSHYGEG
jgi:hypothetical protein